MGGSPFFSTIHPHSSACRLPPESPGAEAGASCDDRTACQRLRRSCRRRLESMRSLTSAAAIVLVSIAAHFTAVPHAQQPAFRSGARTVAIYATVADKDGRLV